VSSCPAPQTCEGGRCAMRCGCPNVLEPLCGEDGQTYFNQCLARCNGVAAAYRGECQADPAPDPCQCAEIHAPVCALSPDGERRTYDNQCVAECHDAEVRCEVACEDAGNQPDACR